MTASSSSPTSICCADDWKKDLLDKSPTTNDKAPRRVTFDPSTIGTDEEEEERTRRGQYRRKQARLRKRKRKAARKMEEERLDAEKGTFNILKTENPAHLDRIETIYNEDNGIKEAIDIILEKTIGPSKNDPRKPIKRRLKSFRNFDYSLDGAKERGGAAVIGMLMFLSVAKKEKVLGCFEFVEETKANQKVLHPPSVQDPNGHVDVFSDSDSDSESSSSSSNNNNNNSKTSNSEQSQQKASDGDNKENIRPSVEQVVSSENNNNNNNNNNLANATRSNDDDSCSSASATSFIEVPSSLNNCKWKSEDDTEEEERPSKKLKL